MNAYLGVRIYLNFSGLRSIVQIFLLNKNLFQYGTFGYNCGPGICDFVPMPDEPEGLQTAFLTIAFGVPFLLIIFSYFTIWAHAKTAACYLRNLRSVYGLF